MRRLLSGCAVALAVGCASGSPEGLALTPQGTGATVKFDVFGRPLPELPLPNDFATRFDPSSPSKRRVNASMEAPTVWEKETRANIDALDGWGTYQTISVGFSKPLDLNELVRRHQGDDYDPSDDAVLLVDITPDSPDYCEAMPLDLGEGNFPLTLERQAYFPNDFHNGSQQLLFEENAEDKNGNGQLDLGEDLDMDGVLDVPNYRFPGAGRFDVMTFYERETNTLLLKPVMPLRESTTYAVVVTRRLLDEDGRPVRSPFTYVNHASQTRQLEPLKGCLARFNLGLDDVAFTWPYTTQSINRDFIAVRDGLYGQGVLSSLSQEFPAKVSKVFPLRKAGAGPGSVYIVPGAQFAEVAEGLFKAQNGGKLAARDQVVLEGMKSIDFHAVFQFVSPQLFPRSDSEGKPLPLYKQVWKLDPQTGEAYTRPETVTLWLTVPKGRVGPAPVAILGHGYTGNKLDPLIYGGLMARYGIATLGMENVSHGVGLSPTDLQLAQVPFAQGGLDKLFDALVKNHRALDQNGDGVADSGADFWTAYIFHTRDVVRQTAVDYMQLIKLLRGFDGAATWDFDVNGDQKPDLAGDFDGDGKVDIGGVGAIHYTGGSLGGIMGTMMAGLEPALSVSVPVSGAAGLLDVGVRSIQGGVAEAVNLRTMGPLLVTLKNDAGGMDLWQVLPDLNDTGRVKLGPVTQPLREGDTAVVTNLKTGESRCARVLDGGLLRAAVSSDRGDGLKLEVYRGPLPPLAKVGCEVPSGLAPIWSFDTLGVDSKFQGLTHKAGEALTALGDGFALRRCSPELRRFLNLAQLAIEKGDPVNYAPNFERRLLKYGTGEEVRTRVLVINTIGDMNVPMATGASIARAAGFLELRQKDARYGKTPNRVLIDNGVLEGVERTGRYKNSKGENVLMDVENLASLSGADDKFDVPRLATPLRLVKRSERVGGYTGVLFPMVLPTGKHGFDTPDPSKSFDLGSVLMNMIGRYFTSGGMELPMEACLEKSTCSWLPAPPQ